MPTSPFRSSTTFSGTTGGTVTVNKPTGTVNGDLVIISFTCRATGLAVGTKAGTVTGFTDPTKNGFGNYYTYFLTKIASGEGASWSLVFDVLVDVYAGAATAWDLTKTAGAVSSSDWTTYTWATTDSVAPYADAGSVGLANSVANKFGIFFAGVADFSSGAGTWTRRTDGTNDDAVQPTTDVNKNFDDSAVVGAGGWLFHRVQEEFRSNAWPGSAIVDANAVWHDTTSFTATMVGGLYLPGVTGPATSGDAWAYMT
jgi:hypothetical protein